MSVAPQARHGLGDWVIGLEALLFLFLVGLFLFWKGSTSELVWQLKHGIVENRIHAADELAKRGRKAIAAAPALKEALGDSNPNVQTLAANALLRMGAWHELNSSDWITKASPNAIEQAEAEIANTDPPPAEALLVVEKAAISGRDPNSREFAVFSLRGYGADALPTLEAASHDTDLNVRNAAQTVLQEIHSKEPHAATMESQ